MTAFAFPKPIRTEKPRRGIKRRKGINPRRETSRRGPARDAAHLAKVRKLPCIAGGGAWGACWGAVEAMHMYTEGRGVGQKCSDLKAAPGCSGHHRAFDTHSGPFAGLTRDQRRGLAEAWVVATLAQLEVRAARQTAREVDAGADELERAS